MSSTQKTIPVPEEAVIKPGSLILVTGVTGYIGAHVADQLLQRGYRVRGVVRKPAEWLVSLFDERYGKGNFEAYFIEDVAKKELLIPAMKDVSGVVHVASDVSFSPDPTIVIPTAINLATAALHASATSPTVTRFVLTSSSAAASVFTPNIHRTITANSWSDAFVTASQAPDPYTPDRSFSTYGASKNLAEKAVFNWAQENKGKTNLVVNSVLPDCNYGLPISPKYQGWPSSVGTLKALFFGDETWGRMLPPQHFISVQDVAYLHIAALLHPDVQNERIFGFAEPKNGNAVLKVLRELYPDRTFLGDLEGEGVDLVTVVEGERAEGLLRWVKGSGWTSLRESLKEVGDYLVEHEEEEKNRGQ